MGLSNKDFGRIYTTIKRGFARSDTYYKVLMKAKSRTNKGVRGGAKYICAVCGKAYSRKDVQVDHVDPVVPVNIATTDMSWSEIIPRIYCSPDNLQVLCRGCHQKKSIEENKIRREIRKQKKEAEQCI